MRLAWTAVLTVGVLVPVVAAQECPPDEVWVVVEGSTALVHHQNALFNCCPTMEYDIVQDGLSIEIVEREVLAECYCVCCFDLIHELHGLAPGAYTVTVRGAYGCENEPCGAAEFTIVAGSGATSTASMMSDCGGWSLFGDGFESGNTSAWSQ